MFKIKRRTNKIIRGALFLLALLFSFHITVKQVIHAKTIPNVITSMKVTDSDGLSKVTLKNGRILRLVQLSRYQIIR